MHISRQSADSQQASTMPQSRSQGRSHAAHSSEPQQKQHEVSVLHDPHVAQSSTMLHSVRNWQKRQARIQCTQQSSSASEGICDAVERELDLLFLLLWLLMEGKDCSLPSLP